MSTNASYITGFYGIQKAMNKEEAIRGKKPTALDKYTRQGGYSDLPNLQFYQYQTTIFVNSLIKTKQPDFCTQVGIQLVFNSDTRCQQFFLAIVAIILRQYFMSDILLGQLQWLVPRAEILSLKNSEPYLSTLVKLFIFLTVFL